MITINYTEMMENLPELMEAINADLEEIMQEEFTNNCEDQMFATFEIAA